MSEYIINHNGETFKIRNLITDRGCEYIFRRCMDKNYTFLDAFKYTLINNVGFVKIANTDTLTNRQWLPFATDNYSYIPTLRLFDQDASIRGNDVDIYIPRDGVIAGVALVGSIILSVAALDVPRPVRAGDYLSIFYNMELP